jgi:transcriptional regulator with XRE-family HTH domain
VNDESFAAVRLRLGRALTQARNEAELTQSDVAASLNCTQGKVNKIETMLVEVSEADLDTMLDVYRLPPERADEIRALWRRCRDEQAGTKPSTAWSPFAQLSHLEPDATEILCWHSERIPGPLQSEPYMLHQHPGTNTNPGVTELLRQRTARARIFAIDDPPWYRAILSESSLARMPGGRNRRLVVEQAEHLVKLMTRHPRLTVQILTYDANIVFVDSDFEILRFGGNPPDFAYIEFPGGAKTFQRATELPWFESHWRLLQEAALSRDESLAFLADLAKI